MSKPFGLNKHDYDTIIFDWQGTLVDSAGQLFPGVRELLAHLKEQNFTLALATSTPLELMNYFIDEFNLSDFFDHIQTSDMGYAKPSGKMLEAVLESVDSSVERAVMIGDSDFDIMMANEAGMTSIGLLSGCSSQEALEKHHPALILNHVVELKQYCQ